MLNIVMDKFLMKDIQNFDVNYQTKFRCKFSFLVYVHLAGLQRRHANICTVNVTWNVVQNCRAEIECFHLHLSASRIRIESNRVRSGQDGWKIA